MSGVLIAMVLVWVVTPQLERIAGALEKIAWESEGEVDE